MRNKHFNNLIGKRTCILFEIFMSLNENDRRKSEQHSNARNLFSTWWYFWWPPPSCVTHIMLYSAFAKTLSQFRELLNTSKKNDMMSAVTQWLKKKCRWWLWYVFVCLLDGFFVCVLLLLVCRLSYLEFTRSVQRACVFAEAMESSLQRKEHVIKWWWIYRRRHHQLRQHWHSDFGFVFFDFWSVSIYKHIFYSAFGFYFKINWAFKIIINALVTSHTCMHIVHWNLKSV